MQSSQHTVNPCPLPPGDKLFMCPDTQFTEKIEELAILPLWYWDIAVENTEYISHWAEIGPNANSSHKS